MSYNGSGTFQINTSGQPVVTGTSISSTVFNALTADLATGLSTAITKDGQTTTTARIPFALGINSTLVTDATNTTSGSIITAGGVGIAKALYVGTTANIAGDTTLSGGTANGVAYLNGSKVLTTGSALVFDGTNLGVNKTPNAWNSVYRAVQIGLASCISGRTDQSEAQILSNAFRTSTGAYNYISTDFASRLEISNGSYYFFNAASGTAGNAITFTQAMTLDGSGNLLVGATSTSFSEKFNSTQSANQKAGLFFNTNANFTNNVLNLRASRNTTNGSYGFLQCSIDGVADKLYIYDSGNVVNTNNSYGALSDVKLKENIVDATPKLDDLLQVKVRNYNLIGDTQKQIGVVAQELETVFPGMIDESCDRDAEGNDLGTTTKSVKYSVFVPMLIKAMQEMKSVIDDQAARIAVLEAK